jgi:radical SAM protein with 4Fe4S-binding SPASM domain
MACAGGACLATFGLPMSSDRAPQPGPGALGAELRAALLRAERPRSRKLPFAPLAEPAKRHLALAENARPADAVRPIYCVWELTLACDLACRHCGSRAGKARPDELTTAECLDLVHQLAELGVKEVSLIGGEAYLRDDWVVILKAITESGMLANLTTGGRGMTAERARAAFTAGLRDASVSVDGLEAAHDRLRGVQGSFRAALDAMDQLRAAGIRVGNNTQINRLTLSDLPALQETLLAHGSSAWQLHLTVPMGRAADEPDVLLQPHDLLELFPALPALKQRADQAGMLLWRGNSLGYFGPYEALLLEWMPDGHSQGCGAGRNVLGIEADGTVKGCPSLITERWAAGNLRDAPLREIWERGGPIRYTRDRTAEDLWGYCSSCYYADTCRAGCTWMSDSLLGRPGNNPYCHHRALELQRAGKRERIRRVVEAPGKPFDAGLFELILEDWPVAEPARASTLGEER